MRQEHPQRDRSSQAHTSARHTHIRAGGVQAGFQGYKHGVAQVGIRIDRGRPVGRERWAYVWAEGEREDRQRERERIDRGREGG
jgi:hypothetical protein